MLICTRDARQRVFGAVLNFRVGALSLVFALTFFRGWFRLYALAMQYTEFQVVSMGNVLGKRW
jgi:hypothetical protein